MLAKSSLTCSLILLTASLFAIDAKAWMEKIEDASDAGLPKVLTDLKNAARREGLTELANTAEKDARNHDFIATIYYLEAMQKLSSNRAKKDPNDSLNKLHLRDDAAPAEGESWLNKAFDRLERDEQEEPQRERQRDTTEYVEPRSLNLMPLAWTLLIVGLGALGFFLFRNFSGFQRTKRAVVRKKGLLSEDEEIGVYHDWAKKAKKFIEAGNLREAMRCYYIAILLRLDAAKLVRFDRYQTNWEHLHRITGSSAPSHIEYRRITKLFDVAWYGHEETTLYDCTEIQHQFEQLDLALKENRS